MNMRTLFDTTESAPDSAEAWLARLNAPDCDRLDRDRFEQWRAADPRHAEDFAAVERIHADAARLADDPLLRAAARAARRQRTSERRRRQAWLAAAAVAGLALVSSVALHLIGRGAPIQHFASNGRVETIHLSDGTTVYLDSGSALSVRMGSSLRDIHLERGRAEFVVVHNPNRPFIVHAGVSTIRDIGTTFQVCRCDDGVTVGLLEGKVEVRGGKGPHAWSSRLAPAQQVHVDNQGNAGTIKPLDMAVARGWVHGNLVFHRRRLGDLLAEMNRYSSTKLRLGDPTLAALRVSGTFHAGDQQSLAKALERGWGLRVIRTAPDELTLLPAATVKQR